MVKVIAHLADGGSRESDSAEDLIQKAAQLRQQGLGDRAIIHVLITNDWGAPPIYVELVPADSPPNSSLRLVY